MTQTSNSYDVLGGGDPPHSNLWDDVQAMMALVPDHALPLPTDHGQAV